MKKLKKLFSLGILTFFVFGFISNLTHIPFASAGGSFGGFVILVVFFVFM